MTDLLLSNVHLATMDNGYGLLHDAALAIKDGRIAWIGARCDAPPAVREYDCGGGWLTPGLIDCHTHIVHGGNRSDEWEARLNGATYEDIARQGGGIMATVRATRALDVDALVAASLPRVKALLAEGVTTLEIKSGYGLALDAEERMLRAARRIGELLPVRVVTTFLGAHALPPEFAGRPDDYMTDVCDVMLPALAAQGLVDAVDAFCERIGFTNAQTARVFDKAGALGLPVKLHAEQLSDQGGAALVARHGGLSADHLDHAANRRIARRWRADGRGHRLQSRHLAADVLAAGAEHGVHAVASHAARGIAGRDRARSARAGFAGRDRHAHGWQARRPGVMEHRATCRSCLRDGFESLPGRHPWRRLAHHRLTF